MAEIAEEKFRQWTRDKNALQARISIFEKIRDIPYAVIPDLNDATRYVEIFEHGKGSCTPKHLLLGNMLQRLGMLVLYSVCRAMMTRGQSIRTDAVLFTAMASATMLATLAWWLATDCNIVTVWRLNLQNHSGFYEQFQRTWWKWMLVNPIELAMAVGLGAFLSCIAGARRALQSVRTTSGDSRMTSAAMRNT